MEVKYEAQITAVGKDARPFLETNSSFILMDAGFRDSLADMVVQHTVSEVKGDIAVGDKLVVGNTDFTVVTVGADVMKNLREGGHCTVVIGKAATLPGQVAVKGSIPPRLRPGDVVKFYAK